MSDIQSLRTEFTKKIKEMVKNTFTFFIGSNYTKNVEKRNSKLIS